jgi:DNA glycosylase AlkZ-like
MAPLTQETPRLVLDEAGAARAWNWILARQGLADGRRLSSAAEIADAALGLHAARLPSPYAIVAARSGDPAVPGTLFTAPVRASLLTVRCMRKTLHALPLPLASAAHAATLRFRDRDAQRAVYNAGYSPAAIEEVICELGALLQDGPLPHRAIEALLRAGGREIRAARLAVKVAWERGVIAYVNATDSWDREARTFTLTASAYPGLDLSLARDQAVTALVTAYFHRYGPATVRDAAWWSGLSATDIATALRRSQRPLVTVATPWSTRPCLMFADQAAEAASHREAAGVQLLAHEDPALKAYYETRDRYLAGLPQRHAFNQIGEAQPAVTVNGTVTGTWSWDSRGRNITVRILPGKTTPAVRRQIRERAAVLTDTLRAGAKTGPRPAASSRSGKTAYPENGSPLKSFT